MREVLRALLIACPTWESNLICYAAESWEYSRNVCYDDYANVPGHATMSRRDWDCPSSKLMNQWGAVNVMASATRDEC